MKALIENLEMLGVKHSVRKNPKKQDVVEIKLKDGRFLTILSDGENSYEVALSLRGRLINNMLFGGEVMGKTPLDQVFVLIMILNTNFYDVSAYLKSYVDRNRDLDINNKIISAIKAIDKVIEEL